MPNAQVLEAKQAQVAEAVELLKNTQTGILVDYRGLNVAEDTELRNKLREANVKYFVIKNKILKRAVDEIGLEGLDEVLHGPTALAVSTEDAVAPAKVLSDFAKSNEKLEIKGGFMDGSVFFFMVRRPPGSTRFIFTASSFVFISIWLRRFSYFFTLDNFSIITSPNISIITNLFLY